VTFEVGTRCIRPAEPSGQPIGGLVYELAEGETSSTAAGVERRLFNQVVVAIMRGYRRTGSAPSTTTDRLRNLRPMRTPGSCGAQRWAAVGSDRHAADECQLAGNG
jgi:hypothetical protein